MAVAVCASTFVKNDLFFPAAASSLRMAAHSVVTRGMGMVGKSPGVNVGGGAGGMRVVGMGLDMA